MKENEENLDMKINGINETNTQMSAMNRQTATDSVSKNIQKQIANAQKQLQEISSNKDMSIEEKMKKRQEIQQQIADLNNQLRQHQIEVRRKQQQKKGSSMDDMFAGSKKNSMKSGTKGAGMSQQCMHASTMQAMISAGSAMAQAQMQGSVATRMNGEAGVLESEIKLDEARGSNVEAKREELAELQEKAVAAEAAQMNTLANTNRELEEAAKADQQNEKTDRDTKTDKKDVVLNEKQNGNVTESAPIEEETVDGSEQEAIIYTHVDIRL